MKPDEWRDRSSHAGDVRGEEVDAVAVEVASGSVVVLGGPWAGVASQDLGIAQRHSGVQSVGDRTMPQRVKADVAGDACDLWRSG